MATSVTDPYLQAYYAMQANNVRDNYNVQLAQDTGQQGVDSVNYSEKMQALRNKLATENDTFRDGYANRGLLNSGIYSNQSPNYGNMGALQQFASNNYTAQQNLLQQQGATNSAFNTKDAALTAQKNDQLAGVSQLQAADVARGSINDAITAGG
jgi:hypothetical protein